VVKLGEVVMILDLHRQGLTVSAIARELGIDRKTVRKCIARGLEPPVYGPRKPRKRWIDPFVQYLRERVTAYPGLTGRRLLRELRERGYEGGYTAVTDELREIRPAPLSAFEIRFETPPGDQAQVDFAQFQLQFTDEPAITRIVWLFSFVLGFSRLIWARFVLHQDMQTVLRCHMAAFNAIGGIPNEILYDRMKTRSSARPAVASSTTERSSTSPGTMASNQRPADRIELKPRARSSGPIVISARTSSSPARSAIWMT
jgi:transposase